MLEITSIVENANVPVTILTLKGEIDSSNYQIFQAEGEALIKKGTYYLLIDFKDVSFMSSAGLRVIHILFNKLREIHKDVDDDELRKKMQAGAYKSPYIKVSNLPTSLKELFELSGFETYIKSYDDVASAIKSF